MTYPTRASTCDHLQCFDANLFLMMNERKPKWLCPVCNKAALYNNLLIDGYFTEVLASSRLPSDDHEIVLHNDGTWDPLPPKKPDHERGREQQQQQMAKETKEKTTPKVEGYLNVDDDSDEGTNKSSQKIEEPANSTSGGSDPVNASEKRTVSVEGHHSVCSILSLGIYRSIALLWILIAPMTTTLLEFRLIKERDQLPFWTTRHLLLNCHRNKTSRGIKKQPLTMGCPLETSLLTTTMTTSFVSQTKCTLEPVEAHNKIVRESCKNTRLHLLSVLFVAFLSSFIFVCPSYFSKYGIQWCHFPLRDSSSSFSGTGYMDALEANTFHILDNVPSLT